MMREVKEIQDKLDALLDAKLTLYIRHYFSMSDSQEFNFITQYCKGERVRVALYDVVDLGNSMPCYPVQFEDGKSAFVKKENLSYSDQILVLDDDAPDITSQAWADEMHEAFWDHWNRQALEEAYMPNPADDRCET